jgi:hypothetical protein
VKAVSWEEPLNDLAEAVNGIAGEALSSPVAGCNRLRFQPTLSLTPETPLADEPTGATVDLNVPQAPPNGLEGTATPPIKTTTVTLPAGMSLSAAAADGLTACPADGPEGIDIDASGAGHCALSSQIGTVEAATPILSEPLRGQVYVAQPGCGGAGEPACTASDAQDGNLFGIYVQLEGSGVVIKLRGSASVDPATGQVTTTFRETPQQPLSDLKVRLKGGPRAPLANPQSCGEALTTSDITPWSTPETPDATPSFAFNVSGCEGSAFAPWFSAGTTSANAGAYTALTTTFTRGDRTQDLGAIQVHTPPGLLGSLAHVTLCEEPQATAGTCSTASQIGTARASAGAGSHPFWVSGPVYLTGPYRGAPFGLSVALPAVAGPFNLGTVVVRSALTIDPHSSALTVTSDPLPQILDGVPLRVQTVNVTVDRPQFVFNPTNCATQQIAASIASAQGSIAQVASPFTAAGCRSLPFKPTFSATSLAKTSKLGGAALDVKVSQAPGQANIRRVILQLPKVLPARLTTLQKACLAAQFDANPAGCPPGSIIGYAKAATPVLSVPLQGPAYLVSHGGAAFPDVVFVLQGQGIRIDVTGATDIKKGITYSRFETVPDAPISSFETILPEGPHSVLTAIASLCAHKLIAPTTIEGQNGGLVRQSTQIKVSGCPKARTSRKGKRARRAAHAHGTAGSGR